MKRLLLLLLIAVGGAGIAYGATTVLFTNTAERAPVGQPRGLVDQMPSVERASTPAPSASPTASPASPGSPGTGASVEAAPAEDLSGSSPRSPRTPRSSGEAKTTNTHVEQGVVSHPSTGDGSDCDSISDHDEREKCREREDKDR